MVCKEPMSAVKDIVNGQRIGPCVLQQGHKIKQKLENENLNQHTVSIYCILMIYTHESEQSLLHVASHARW